MQSQNQDEVTQCNEQVDKSKGSSVIKPNINTNQIEDDSRFQKQLMNYQKQQNNGQQQKQIKQNKLVDNVQTNNKEQPQMVINDKNIIQINKQEEAYQQGNNKAIQMITGQVPQQQNQQQKSLNSQNESYVSIVQPKFQKLQINQNMSNPSEIKEQQFQIIKTQPQVFTQFSQKLKSSTIKLNPQKDQAQQGKSYFQNQKLSLTDPILSQQASIQFRLDNLKYCLGFGIALQEIVEKHNYDYESTTENELGHGLYLVTTQGYSWSHSQQEQDDIFRDTFNSLYSGVSVKVKIIGNTLQFQWKKGSFSLQVPSRIRQKYTLCFCVYLHEKTDSISLVKP